MDENDTVFIIGITAGILTAASMMPQVIKTIKTKKADHVSALMLIILIGGIILWIIYGVMKKDMPIICTNGFSLLVNLVMLFLRWKFGGEHGKLQRSQEKAAA
jgi:MtN3 and saliva related transmembrane protein